MEKNTVQTSVLIQNPNITITSVASYRNFVFVSAYGDKLYIYTIRKGKTQKIFLECRKWKYQYFGSSYYRKLFFLQK